MGKDGMRIQVFTHAPSWSVYSDGILSPSSQSRNVACATIVDSLCQQCSSYADSIEGFYMQAPWLQNAEEVTRIMDTVTRGEFLLCADLFPFQYSDIMGDERGCIHKSDRPAMRHVWKKTAWMKHAFVFSLADFLTNFIEVRILTAWKMDQKGTEKWQLS